MIWISTLPFSGSCKEVGENVTLALIFRRPATHRDAAQKTSRPCPAACAVLTVTSSSSAGSVRLKSLDPKSVLMIYVRPMTGDADEKVDAYSLPDRDIRNYVRDWNFGSLYQSKRGVHPSLLR